MRVFSLLTLFLIPFKVTADDFIVSLKRDIPSVVLARGIEKFQIGPFNGLIIKNTTIKEVKKIPFVDAIEKDSQVSIYNQWGLLRISNKDIPNYKKDKYDPHYDGEGVDIYVIDTGVKNTHVQFKENRVKTGWNTIKKNTDTEDKNGHGTHVSSTVIGVSVGVSTKANVIPIKVLSDNGSGYWSDVIKGIEWVVKNVKKTQKCSIINMSVGGWRNNAVNRAVNTAHSQGIPVVVAAGNNNGDSCLYSPASATSAITVGSSNEDDYRSSFSNKGDCINIWAPGSSIVGAGIKSNTELTTLSGTSMASPHVAGVLAQIMQVQGCDNIDKVIEKLYSDAVFGKVKNVPSGTKNILLQIPKGSMIPTVSPTERPTKTSCIKQCKDERKKENCEDLYDKCGCMWIPFRTKFICRKVCDPIT